MVDKEQLKPVPGYTDLFASEDGNIYRELKSGRLSRQNPYLIVRIGDASAKTAKPIHQLVAAAFYGPRPADAVTRHLDGNSMNNHKDNLAWGTAKQNHEDAVRHGTRKPKPKPIKREQTGGGRPQGSGEKLTAEDVTVIRQRIAEGYSKSSIAKVFGVSLAHVSGIANGKTWTHLLQEQSA